MKAINDKIVQGKDLEIGKAYVLVSRHEFVSNDEFGEQFLLTEGMVEDIPRGELFYEVDLESTYPSSSYTDVLKEEESDSDGEEWFHKKAEYKQLSDFDKKVFESLLDNLTIEIDRGGRDLEYVTGVSLRFRGLDIDNSRI